MNATKEYQVRKADAKDKHEIYMLQGQLAKLAPEKDPWFYDEYWVEYHLNTTYVCEYKGRIVGCITGNDHYDEVETLIVRRYYRKRGIGSKLLHHFFDIAKMKKVNYIELGSWKSFKAKPFYLKMGFKVDSIHQGYYDFIYKN